MSVKKEKTFIEKLKELVGSASEKDFNMTCTDGKIITCVDPDGDGKPMVGDMVNDDQGNPLKDSTLNINDGSTIMTDADGKISSITPAGGSKAAPAATTTTTAAAKSVEERLTALEAELAEEKRAHKEDNDASLESINALTERLSKIKSTGEPKTSSSTQFRGQASAKKEMSKEEYKKEMQERKNLKK